MKARRSVVALAALVALSAAIAFSGIARPASADGGGIATRSYVQTNLVSDIPGLAAHTDPNLKNPWGTSVGPRQPALGLRQPCRRNDALRRRRQPATSRSPRRPRRGTAPWDPRPGRRSTPS